jgi:hypothetical protein
VLLETLIKKLKDYPFVLCVAVTGSFKFNPSEERFNGDLDLILVIKDQNRDLCYEIKNELIVIVNKYKVILDLSFIEYSLLNQPEEEKIENRILAYLFHLSKQKYWLDTSTKFKNTKFKAIRGGLTPFFNFFFSNAYNRVKRIPNETDGPLSHYSFFKSLELFLMYLALYESHSIQNVQHIGKNNLLKELRNLCLYNNSSIVKDAILVLEVNSRLKSKILIEEGRSVIYSMLGSTLCRLNDYRSIYETKYS